MRRTRIRPAFVATLAALSSVACQKQQPHGNPPPPTATVEQVPPTTNTDEVSANPPPVRTTRKVRDPVPPQYEQFKGNVDYAKVKHLNPHGRENRLIMAAQNGTCFIEVPIDPKAPIGPPGTGLRSEQVPCPDVMQDPAWDTCLNGDLGRLESGECICERMSNPPPPPSKAECPK